MDHYNLYIIVVLLGLCSTVMMQESCLNPVGQSGICINIKKCEPLIALLKTHGNSVADFLRSSVCGYEGFNPKVCCAIDDNTDDVGGISVTTPKPRDSGESTGKYQPLYAPTCGISNNTYSRVVGGTPAALGAWPWAVALGYHPVGKRSDKPSWNCGGTLVSSRHVITAAHCIHGHEHELYVVRLGELDLDENVPDGATPIDIRIEKIHKHPQYNPNYHTNDIAIIKLVTEVEFSDLIKPICLPWPDDIYNLDLVSTLPFIVGWGSTWFRGRSATHLQQLQIPVVTNESCKLAFQRFKNAVIDNRVLCAGYARGGKDACQGDSGGPLMYPQEKVFYLIGVVSYGFRCAEPGIPGVYTRVTEFKDFIQSRLV